jgi:hypothetical protein
MGDHTLPAGRNLDPGEHRNPVSFSQLEKLILVGDGVVISDRYDREAFGRQIPHELVWLQLTIAVYRV